MIYVLLADGFEEVEAIEPIDIMRRAGLEVVTVGVENKNVKGAHGITVIADILADEVEYEEMELLMLPGGVGYEILDKNQTVEELIEYATKNGIYIAAICAAPSILGKRGLLDGKSATCFPGFEQFLKGAKITGDKVVKDGKIITAKGAGAAAEFGFEIVKTLKNKETAEELRCKMQY